MERRFKKLVLFLPLGLALVLFLLVLLADAWLESSTGRNKLESALERSLGMPVDLQGDFSITLLPSPGVSGSGLSVGAESSGSAFFQSRDYHAAIELLPLIDGELKVLSVSAIDGLLDVARYRRPEASATGDGKSKVRLPVIERLELENILLVLPGSDDNSLLIRNLELEAFREDELSPMMLELSLQSSDAVIAVISAQSKLLVSSGLGQVSVDLESLELNSESLELSGIHGQIIWSDEQELLKGQFAWEDPALGSGHLTVNLHPATSGGMVELEFAPSAHDQELNARLNFESKKQGIFLDEIFLSFGDQAVTGVGCLLTAQSRALHLSLNSEFLDIEALNSLFPDGSGMDSGMGSGPGSGPGSDWRDELPVDFNVKLTIGEMHIAGAIVHQAEINLGHAPQCEDK